MGRPNDELAQGKEFKYVCHGALFYQMFSDVAKPVLDPTRRVLHQKALKVVKSPITQAKKTKKYD